MKEEVLELKQTDLLKVLIAAIMLYAFLSLKLFLYKIQRKPKTNELIEV